MELIPGLPNDIARECLIRVPYKHLGKVSAVCKAWKSDMESGKFYGLRKARGLSTSVIVLTQAELKWDSSSGKYPAQPVYHLTVYEPKTGVWERLMSIPGYSNGIPLFCQCAGVGSSLVMIGGWDPTSWKVSREVHVYDFLTATWKRGADMPGPSRSFFACASDWDQMVFVAGGHDEEKNALKSVLAYDVIDDKWISVPDMERERDECHGIFSRGKFHVIGGYCSEKQGQFERSVESFDVATWQWSPVKEGELESGECPKTCVADNKGNIHNLLCDDGANWKPVIEIVLDVCVGTTAVTWQDKIMVIGSAKYGGPNSCYVYEGGKWAKAECPEKFRGHVETGCSLEI